MFWSKSLAFYPYQPLLTQKLNKITVVCLPCLLLWVYFFTCLHLLSFFYVFRLSSVLSVPSFTLQSSAIEVPASPLTFITNFSVYPLPPLSCLSFFSCLLVSGHYHPWFQTYHSISISLLRGTISTAGEPKRNSGGFEATMVCVLKAIYIPKSCCSKSDFHASWIEGTF